jgi:WD40 repeat protein
MEVDCSPDSSQVLAVGLKGALHLWNFTTNQVQVFETFGKTILHLAFLPNKQAFLIAGPHVLEIRSLTDGATLNAFSDLEDRWLSSVAVSPDASLVAIGYGEDILLWDTQTGAVLPPLVGHEFGVLAVAFIDHGKRLVSVGYDAMARLWEVSSGAELKHFEVYSTPHSAVAIDLSTNTMLVSGGRMPFVCRWHITRGEQISCLNDVNTPLWVNNLAIGPNGHWALSDDPHNGMTLWNLETGRAVRQFNAGGGVYGLAICPNGDYGLSASDDGVINVWNLQTE